MAKYQAGLNALDALNTEASGNTGMEFFSLKSGTSVKVRVLGLQDMITFRSYGIFKKVNSFVAENPSTYNAKGFPQSNLTPWDRAFDYYSQLAFANKDAQVQKDLRAEGRKYLGKERFALGFINVETGEPIIIDFSKKQAKTIHAAFMKNEKKLDKKAFEIEKSGSGTDTVVNAHVLDLDDLSDKEAENFKKYDGASFDMTLFDDILYEADEKEQMELLAEAGFDLAQIGASLNDEEESPQEPKGVENPFDF